MLFPLIESSRPEQLLRAWQRSPEYTGGRGKSNNDDPNQSPLEKRLESLLCFLKGEVEGEQRILLASESFELRSVLSNGGNKNPDRNQQRHMQKTFEQKVPTAAGLVNCNVVACIFCQGSHESTLCFKAQAFTFDRKKELIMKKKGCFRCLAMGHQAKCCRARLQCVICAKSHVTLMCPELPAHKQNSCKSNEKREPEQTGTEFGEPALANYSCSHVFLQTLRVQVNGGSSVREVRALIDTGSQRSYILASTALDLGCTSKGKERIIPSLFGGAETMQNHNCYHINVSKDDYYCNVKVLDQPSICNAVSHIFYGPWINELEEVGIRLSDTSGSVPIELLIGADFAGKLYTGRRHILKNELVAVETTLGWTLISQVPTSKPDTSTTMTVLSLFVKDASIANLWELDLLGIAEPTTKRSPQEMADAAKELFLQTIEVNGEGRYEVRLPWLEGHPPLPDNYSVSKNRLKTTIKKVTDMKRLEAYDAVFREWLEEGIIEEIKFDQSKDKCHYLPHRPVVKDQKIGVVSDIHKAFLQISLHEADRDFLRFFWVNADGDEIIYRHKRVVFGVNCSPFLLGATIEYHLSQGLKQCETEDVDCSVETISQLQKSFYVDNCVTSVPSEVVLKRFIRESNAIMNQGCFDLRGWEFTDISKKNGESSVFVLGLNWNTQRDTLSLVESNIENVESFKECVTKRVILSTTQRIFDPIGFTCPTTLIPKLLLQRIWQQQLSWDMPVDEEIKSSFLKWLRQVRCLLSIEIPRWIRNETGISQDSGLHLFCDASKNAYAAVVFLRVCHQGEVHVNLLLAKTRVARLRGMTIPRLELLVATIGARLYVSVKESLNFEGKSFFWSDSSTVLCWIGGSEEWAPFVGNRVKEIRSLTDCNSWRHVPGELNPADLPSRGCSGLQLLESRWWEGPDWLCREPALWPQETVEYDEVEINREKRKRPVTTLMDLSSDYWHLTYFLKCTRIVRMVAWIFRFVNNLRKKRISGVLTSQEINEAEIFVLKIVQNQSFGHENDERLSTLRPFIDKDGLIRLKTRVSNREDTEDLFSGSVACETPTVRDATVFEIVGIDFAGPLYLKSGEKAWVCLFTCAIYRTVHLELTTSMSTSSFIQVLRRFVARRGRPKTIYTDNGTNFCGAKNAFAKLNWTKMQDYASVRRITWYFNPPTASWWGGFWERLIRVSKRLLRKILGRASLNYEELVTLVYECKDIINARPITYQSSDPGGLTALTPSMFLRDREYSGMPECDAVDRAALCRRVRYRQKLCDDLRRRFRTEYLGQLRLYDEKRSDREIVAGEIVLVGKDGKTRLVRVAIGKGQVLRLIQRLYPLECSEVPTRSEGECDLKVCPAMDTEAIHSIDIDIGVQPNQCPEESEGAGVIDRGKNASVIEGKTTRSGRMSCLPRRYL
ncbi:hypothetical protein ILUMI_26468 [Ignelater luminosus]|uniref:Integrase catalytic domain-containing protein n=1 Tax=Ignelater luminosus TaxID=2038154 RepID=A0A8K0FVX4_IGNLU|nr:hypothetical protein ILUMI_26468 [Ignelater luminosus]